MFQIQKLMHLRFCMLAVLKKVKKPLSYDELIQETYLVSRIPASYENYDDAIRDLAGYGIIEITFRKEGFTIYDHPRKDSILSVSLY